MNVEQIITNAVKICGLGDNPDATEKNIYLGYLNKVNEEIYRFVVDVHPELNYKQEDLLLTNGVSEPLRDFFPKIKNVCTDAGFNLQITSLGSILNKDPLMKETGNPSHYYLFNKKICVFPKVLGEQKIHVLIAEQPKELEHSSPETDIPYPPMYHQILVDGLCTHISIDELGENRNLASKVFYVNYEQGKKNLHAYFCNQYTDHSFSTYRAY